MESLSFFVLKGVKNALKDDKLTNASLQEYLLLMVTEYYEKKYNKCTQTPYMWGKKSKTVIIIDYFNFELINDFKIADIYFGIIDADNEYKKDKKVFIDNYYDMNEAAKKIEEQNNVQYIFGKKGTGKTYIGRYLEEKMGNNMKYLSLNKFNYKAFSFWQRTEMGMNHICQFGNM